MVAATSVVVNGVDATATGVGASAGTKGQAANGATAYGAQSFAQDTNSTAIGFRATAKQAGSTAAGYQAQALADPSTAFGADSLVTANADNGVAIGASATVTAANSVALGFNSKATASSSVALGTNSVADQSNTVSVGSAGAERRITNVAPGVQATDAVNVSQLGSVQQQLSGQIRDLGRIAYSGTAMAMAMSGTYMPTLEAGEKALGVGVGNYKGYAAIGVNFKALNKEGKMSWGLGVSTTGKDWGVNAGVGWKWK